MKPNKDALRLRRADFTAAPLTLWHGSPPVWADRPMPLWRDVLAGLWCAVRHARRALARRAG